MSNAPFFIVGIGRSGTTLLRLMFHNHPDIAIPYESHFITDYYENIKKYGDLSDAVNLRALVNDILNEELILMWDHKFDLDSLIDKISTPTLSNVFRVIYDDYAAAKGKKRWGDKSDYLDRMHIINEMFPDAKFIHIIRDGRDVANSVLKLPWGPSDLIQAAEWWHSHVILGRRMGAMLSKDRYTEIKYEDLVTNSEAELKRLCTFLEIDFSDEMMDYHKKANASIPKERGDQHYNAGSPPKSSRCYAWKKEMSSADVAVFNSFARNSLTELGYEVSQQQVGKFTVLFTKIKIFIKRFI